jgi:hypothetical protein
MFQYDNPYLESDWRHEADARELAQLDADRRDMQETPPPVITLRSTVDEKCCDNPGNFTVTQSFQTDSETGYWEPNYFRCGGCGTLICEEDYAALVELSERRLRMLEKKPKKPGKKAAA